MTLGRKNGRLKTEYGRSGGFIMNLIHDYSKKLNLIVDGDAVIVQPPNR